MLTVKTTHNQKNPEILYGVILPAMGKNFTVYRKQPHLCEYHKTDENGEYTVHKLYEFKNFVSDGAFDLKELILGNTNRNPFLGAYRNIYDINENIIPSFENIYLKGTEGTLTLFKNKEDAIATKIIFMEYLENTFIEHLESLKKKFYKNNPKVYNKENVQKQKEIYAEFFI